MVYHMYRDIRKKIMLCVSEHQKCEMQVMVILLVLSPPIFSYKHDKSHSAVRNNQHKIPLKFTERDKSSTLFKESHNKINSKLI